MTKRLIVIIPHEDDETLSMWPIIHYLASGYEVHFVFMTRGEVTATSLRLDGGVGGGELCRWADHNYIHDPEKELYAVPTVEEIGLARLHEGISCAGIMATIPPTVAGGSGMPYWHDENLGTNFGCGGCASSTAPVIPEAVDIAEVVIRRYIDEYPNSLFWTMSPTDAHPDHAACGMALRRLKNDPVLGPSLVNSMFFVSKLWWSTPLGTHGSRLGEPCQWYPGQFGSAVPDFPRRAEYTAFIRSDVMKAYTSWNPAQGSFAIGAGHSTPSQFANCFGSGVTVAAALWHK